MLALTAGPYPRHLGQRLLLAGVVLAPVLLLRRWPLPVLAATTAANVLLITTGVAPLPFGIMLGVASYFAAARLPRRVSIRAAVISAAAVGGALIYTALTVQHAAVAGEAVESLLPLMAGWFTGDSAWPAAATWPGWPSRRATSKPPKPNGPASKSARNGSASPANCTTSWPTPSR